MPILAEQVGIAYKVLPITLNADGSAVVTLTKGYMADGVFTPIDGQVVHLSTEEAQGILNEPATEGATRRDDLSNAIYALLIENGIVSGEIA